MSSITTMRLEEFYRKRSNKNNIVDSYVDTRQEQQYQYRRSVNMKEDFDFSNNNSLCSTSNNNTSTDTLKKYFTQLLPMAFSNPNWKQRHQHMHSSFDEEDPQQNFASDCDTYKDEYHDSHDGSCSNSLLGRKQQHRQPLRPMSSPISSSSNNATHNLPTTKIQLRTIQSKDRQQIQSLHEEWFPVKYQDEFYHDLCEYSTMCHSGHKLYTLIATTPKTTCRKVRDDEENEIQNEENDNNDDNHYHDNDGTDEQIIACLVGCIINANQLNGKSRQLLVPEYPQRHSKLFYIMTLGVQQEYRHLGLASHLVESCINDIIHVDCNVGTIYLHVITTNNAAIQFYEQKLQFWNVQEIDNYYTIDNEQYNCYLYAKYFHGNRGHLDVFKVVSRWISSFWSSFSYLVKSRKYYR